MSIVHCPLFQENAVHDSSYFKCLKHRHNVILMGDSLGDLRMADGADGAENVLKIGFLNDKVDEKLDVYMDSFDIVLVDDQTMDVANWILEKVLEERKNGD